MGRWIAVIIIGAMLISSPCWTFAQEEDVEYGYGTVITVDEAKKEIAVSEYDWESESDTTVTYSLDPNVELEGAGSLKEISPDDYVDIEYVTDAAGKKTAKYIRVYEEESTE